MTMKKIEETMSRILTSALRTHALGTGATLVAIGLLASCGSSDNGATDASKSQPEQSAKPGATQALDRVPEKSVVKEAGSFNATITGAAEGNIAWTGATATRQRDRLTIMAYGSDDAGSGAMAKLEFAIPGKGHEAPVGTYPMTTGKSKDPAHPNDLAMVSFHPAGTETLQPLQVSTMLGGPGEVMITKSGPEEISGTFQFNGSFMGRTSFKQEKATVKGSFRALDD